MANKVIEYAKRNPGKTTLAVGVGVVLMVMVIGGRKNPDTEAATGGYPVYGTGAYTEGMMQYGVQMAQIQAQQTGANNQLTAQLEALNVQSKTQLQSIALQNEGQIALANIAKAAALDQIGASVQVNKDTLAAQYQIASMQSLENMHAMDTNKQITAMQLSSQVEALQIQSQRDLGMQQMFIGGQVQLAGISADVTKYSLLQNTEQAKINADMTKYIAGKQASASKSSSKWGAIAGVASAAIMAFCDVNIKEIDGCVSTGVCLDVVRSLPLDQWQYREDSLPGKIGDNYKHVGTYAQDFYKALGVEDWRSRTRIDHVDMFGVLIGAIKELDNGRKN